MRNRIMKKVKCAQSYFTDFLYLFDTIYIILYSLVWCKMCNVPYRRHIIIVVCQSIVSYDSDLQLLTRLLSIYSFLTFSINCTPLYNNINMHLGLCKACDSMVHHFFPIFPTITHSSNIEPNHPYQCKWIHIEPMNIYLGMIVVNVNHMFSTLIKSSNT